MKSEKSKLNSLGKKILLIALSSLFTSHLTGIENFPFSRTYTFPLFSMLTSFVLGSLIILIVELNLAYFERTYFKRKVSSELLRYYIFRSFILSYG